MQSYALLPVVLFLGSNLSLAQALAGAAADQPTRTPSIPATVLPDTNLAAYNATQGCPKTPVKAPLNVFAALGHRNANEGTYKIGNLEMRSQCLPPQTEITVANQQMVTITLAAHPGQICVALPTFKSDPKPDYGAAFSSFFLKFAGVGMANFLPDGSPAGDQEQQIILPPSSSGTLTVAIACSQPDSNPPQIPRTIVVHYTNVAAFSASAGALVSTLGKKVYGTSTSQTGVGTTGVATTENTVSVTSTSRVQFVPIAFLNTYLIGSNALHLDLESGVGINPNGSKTQVEYFFGPALSTHGIYISPGLHIARAQYLTGGFSLNEIVPSGVTVPVVYRATLHFGISISFGPSIAKSK